MLILSLRLYCEDLESRKGQSLSHLSVVATVPCSEGTQQMSTELNKTDTVVSKIKSALGFKNR